MVVKCPDLHRCNIFRVTCISVVKVFSNDVQIKDENSINFAQCLLDSLLLDLRRGGEPARANGCLLANLKNALVSAQK